MITKLKSATSKKAVRGKVKVREAGTHVGVFGHGVKLEEQRALDDLTHLIDAEENIHDERSGFSSLMLQKINKIK